MRCKQCKRSFRSHKHGILSDHHWGKQECAKCHYLGFYRSGFNRDNESHWGFIRGADNKPKYNKIENIAVTEKNFNQYSKLRKIITGKKPKTRHAITQWRNKILRANEEIIWP